MAVDAVATGYDLKQLVLCIYLQSTLLSTPYSDLGLHFRPNDGRLILQFSKQQLDPAVTVVVGVEILNSGLRTSLASLVSLGAGFAYSSSSSSSFSMILG